MSTDNRLTVGSIVYKDNDDYINQNRHGKQEVQNF